MKNSFVAEVSFNYLHSTLTFKRQPHKMVKHAQTIRWQQPTNCLSVFDHFLGLALKGLTLNIFSLNRTVSVPSAPLLSLEVKDRSIILRWNVTQEGKSPIEYYLLNGTFFNKTLPSSRKMHEDQDLEPETQYRYSLQACNKYGCSKETAKNTTTLKQGIYFYACFDVLSDN